MTNASSIEWKSESTPFSETSTVILRLLWPVLLGLASTACIYFDVPIPICLFGIGAALYFCFERSIRVAKVHYEDGKLSGAAWVSSRCWSPYKLIEFSTTFENILCVHVEQQVAEGSGDNFVVCVYFSYDPGNIGRVIHIFPNDESEAKRWATSINVPAPWRR
jgi:hypothetical protein